MSLYLTKVKWKFRGSTFPTPQDLLNIDLFTEYKQLDCKLSVIELNRFFKDEPFKINGNDIQAISYKGFTVLWHQSMTYWLLIDMDSPSLVDFKREFKLRQILDNRDSKLNEVPPI